MRLCSMEMQGFKSFPDRIRLTFKEGITAVVGPNGSGKSNIADAMRWVLGEQSSKTLRGGKMEDVIFGGTQLRRPQGFAMVQMTMDNRDRSLSMDEDEVTISRKLYRSGDSEYAINGVNVRLKDVHQLFMDTGLGRDGYSIIGQGKIAEIVGAKSRERREIFEEAAGIAKYRYRREEALRNLQNAQENLSRLQDILSELEGRVEPLRVQAEKAKTFLRLRAEKEELEVSLWVRSLGQSQRELRQQEDKLQICSEQYKAIEKRLEECQEEMENCALTLRQTAMEVDRQELLRKTAENRRHELRQQGALLENDVAHSRENRKQLEQQLADLQLSEGELREKVTEQNRLAQRQEEVLTQLSGDKRSVLTRQRETSGLMQSLQKEVEGQKERRFALQQSINDIRLEGASSQSRMEETQRRIEALRENAAAQDEQIARMEEELQACRQLTLTLEETIHALENQKKGYLLRKEKQTARLQELEQQRRAVLDKGRECANRAKLLLDMEKRLEGFGESVKFVTSMAESGMLRGVYGPVSRLLQVSEKYAVAVEIALGGAMQNIVVDTEQTAKNAIAMLKNQKKGRGTFLPLTTVKGRALQEPWLTEMRGYIGVACELVDYEQQFQGVMQQLLGRIVVAEDLDSAIAIARRGGHRFRIVTLDGQLVNVGGSMTGGYIQRSMGILNRRQDIAVLQKQAEDCESQAAAMEEQYNEARESIAATEASILGIEGEAKTAGEDLIRGQTTERQIQKNLDQAQETKAQGLREYDEILAGLEKLRSAGRTHEEMLSRMQERLTEVALSLQEKSEENLRLTRLWEQLREESSGIELREVSLQKERETTLTIARQYQQQLEDGEARRKACREQMDASGAQEEALLRQIRLCQRELEKHEREVAESEQKLAQLRQQRDVLEARENQYRSSERSALEEKASVGRELSRLEEKHENIRQAFQEIIDRLWDEYALTRTQAQERAKPIGDPQAAQRQLIGLKNQIKALGNVNVSALEEYKEVRERYETLLGQTKDADKTRRELLRLIEQLTEEMRIIFSKSFREIAGHFAEIFQSLFGGGQAALTLTDPENVLESGIEISVQPPGKVIGNLSALSGGEQSFVAIALYFAILKVRPSPFVLLDEIEAALDEVNVAKFAAYLRNVCEKTQFIAITHRRGTMEAADVLYGVTMEEKGVSKLLVLQVAELESRLGISTALH